MVRIKRAVLDTGPLIHLDEIKGTRILELIQDKCITPEVQSELRGLVIKYLKILPLVGKYKDLSQIIAQQHELDLGESTCIALCHQEHILHFFTDDLDARDVARRLNLKAHGTLALVLRALREGVLSEKEALNVIDSLHITSSLYVTEDLIRHVKREVARWSKP